MGPGIEVPRADEQAPDQEQEQDGFGTEIPVGSRRFSRELSRRRSLELGLASSLSKRGWTVPDNVFARESDARNEQDGPGDDEQALTWAAIQRLPTYSRLRTTVLATASESGRRTLHQQVDVTKLGFQERQRLIDKLLAVAHDDNEAFLKKLRARIDTVGIKVPTVEVRYQNLSVEGDIFVGDRNLPTLLNTARTILEAGLRAVGIPLTRKVVHPILKDVSGIVEPGRMTLLLGPPASGKTSLLLALAGRLTSDLRVKGKVTYNGKDFTQFVPQKTSAYIGQTDLHTAEMTVRETLDFSAWCQGVGTRYEMLSELIRREKEAAILPEADIDLYMKATAIEGVKSSLVTDYTLKILGLDICADIIVGDNMKRGISGGQKKRVTTGEMIVGPTKTLFMDEISNGLDSSTTFHIVKSLRHFVHVLDSTIVISLLQPAPETYDLFDDIILLSEGQIVYHGPCEHVLPFFEECGFRCPERKGTADFLQEVISKKDQYQYWYDEQRSYQYVTLTDFANKFKEFHVGQRLAARLGTSFDKAASHPAALASDKYSISKRGLLKANWEREWLLMKRNVLVYRIKATQLGIVAFIAGTIFFRTRLHYDNPKDGQIYILALFYGLVVIMFNGFAELSLTIQRLPVFFKQRDLQLYPAWAYAIPAIVLKIPISFLESFVFTAITYFLVGYAPDASRFFRQFLIYFLEHLTAAAIFRAIAAVCRSMVVASTAGSGALLIALVCGGFLIPRPNIPHWWIWAYWASPLTYVEIALSVNEMLAPRWMKRFITTATGETQALGVYLLESRGLFSKESWYWISVGALLGFIILLNVVYILALTYLDPINKPQAIISKEEHAKTDSPGPELSSKNENGADIFFGPTRSLSRHPGKLSRKDVEMVASKSASSNNGDTVLEAAAIAPTKGMILPFIPLGLSFDNVGYSVDMPPEMKAQGIDQDKLQLLRNVSGAFRPGILTALVGVSGAGKTTLMDVLAGRKTGGYVEGDIRISGFPKKQETFARISGYCEQNDIHSPQVTVYESLLFSAWLRLSHDVPKATKMVFVEEVMELVELTPLRNAMVGLPGVSGLSTEQRKRLTIAVELVANPSIIFMDEPTSGLDARAAAIVMRAVRNTVDTGRTVVCTIHQPSIDIFESFDELMLLKRGGQVIYAGPLGRHSNKLIEYFEAVPGVPKMKEGVNPSTWMLEISSTVSESRLGVDFAEIYANSALHQQNKALIKELSVPGEGAQDLYFPTEYSQPFLVQMHACLWKQMWSYWRSPGYNLVRFSFTTFATLVLGSLFWRAGRSIQTQQDLYNVMGSMYGGTMFMGINNSISVQPVVSVERTVFYRERGAGLYSPLAYALSQVIIEIPYVLFQTTVHVLIAYALIGYDWDPAKFFWYFYIAFCTFLYFTFYGMTAVALTPNLQLSNILSSAFYFLFNLFSGFIIPRPRIPPWWIWLYWICPVGWTVTGLLTSQYADLESMITLVTGESVTVKQFMKSNFGYTTSLLPAVGVVILLFPLLFASLFIFGTKKLNFQWR